MERTIGGVFGLETSYATSRVHALLTDWARDAASYHLFHNARSALACVLGQRAPSRVWLPAYLCPDVTRAARRCVAEVCYYGVGERLEADTDALDAALRSGDAVVAMHYFGRPPRPAMAELARSRADVLFIEDAAQSLDGGCFADFRIFSPRKLFGVADGGVLVDMEGSLRAPRLRPPDNELFERPYRLRAEDPEGLDNEVWYAAFREAEAGMAVADWAMSDASRAVIETYDARSILARRRENHAQLLEGLPDLALFEGPPDDWSPLFFPIRTAASEELWRHLVGGRIFAPRHWQGLPSPRGAFPAEHALSAELISLPCDHRYGAEDMGRVIRRVREICR